MTYTELDKSINQVPSEELKAWRVIKLLNDRKGFEHWWHEIGAANRDEIFDDLKKLVNQYF